jgi:hypothetical protein
MHKTQNSVKCDKENKEIKRAENYQQRRDRWRNKNKKYERNKKKRKK